MLPMIIKGRAAHFELDTVIEAYVLTNLEYNKVFIIGYKSEMTEREAIQRALSIANI